MESRGRNCLPNSTICLMFQLKKNDTCSKMKTKSLRPVHQMQRLFHSVPSIPVLKFNIHKTEKFKINVGWDIPKRFLGGSFDNHLK